MKLATWNVNSLKVRLPQVLDWLAAQQVEVLCLQETKQQDADFPRDELQAAGYYSVFAGQKTYNGVAILSRKPVGDIQTSLPGFPDEQKRVIAATLDDIRVVCVYVPNGQSVDSDKYHYKLAWLDALHAWLDKELSNHPRLVVLGDFNIAPADRDVYDPLAWQGSVLVSAAERAAFHALEALGLHDSFRCFTQPDKSYSWWDYRMKALQRNMGMRIDHILVSHALLAQCASCTIDKSPRKLERPSDHAPVILELG